MSSSSRSREVLDQIVAEIRTATGVTVNAVAAHITATKGGAAAFITGQNFLIDGGTYPGTY